MGVALALFQHALAHDDEAHARRAFQAFARGGNDGVKRGLAGVDVDRTERAHGVHDQALAMPGHHLRHLVQRIEHAGAGLAVHQGDMGDGRIGGERLVHVGGADLLGLAVVDGRQLAPEHLDNARQARAVGPVVRHQHIHAGS